VTQASQVVEIRAVSTHARPKWLKRGPFHGLLRTRRDGGVRGSQYSPTSSVKWTVQFGGMPDRKRKASDNVFIMHRILWSYARDKFSPHAASNPEGECAVRLRPDALSDCPRSRDLLSLMSRHHRFDRQTKGSALNFAAQSKFAYLRQMVG
jgi:hypothetical protein